MFKNLSPHSRALLVALFVTFLWSTSWVFIKIGLADIPPITFTGLRYTAAFLCLLPFALTNPARRKSLTSMSRSLWIRLVLLGVIFIAVTQAAQYVALDHMPSATVSLLLNFSAIIVAFMGIVFLSEWPTLLQWGGTILFMGGVLLYFHPVAFSSSETIGLLATLTGVIGTAVSSVLGRQINREGKADPFMVTFVSFGIGSIILLLVGFGTERPAILTPTNILIILWLAAVNTAFAYVLWNQTLKVLSAVESSMINNAMMIQIPIMAWVFLGEALSGQKIIAMVIAGVGVALVQLRGRQQATQAAPSEALAQASEDR